MYSLVLDLSALIPCSEKTEKEKEAILWLGHILSSSCPRCRITIYFSSQMIKTYCTKMKSKFKNCHPLPPFQASLNNLCQWRLRETEKFRNILCKAISLERGVEIHILEKSRIEQYDVSDVGLADTDDVEVLRVALASACQKTFLVTTDRHFFNDLNQARLFEKYPNESRMIQIVSPADRSFRVSLEACTNNYAPVANAVSERGVD